MTFSTKKATEPQMVLIYATPGTYSSNKKFPECPTFQMQFGMLGTPNIVKDTGQPPLTKSELLECDPQEAAPTNGEAGSWQPREQLGPNYSTLCPQGGCKFEP